MNTFATAVSLGAIASVIVLAAATLEMYRSLQQVQQALHLTDENQEVDISELSTRDLHELGFPKVLVDQKHVVLFVSPKCGTCETLMRGLAGTVPSYLSIVVACPTLDEGSEWIARFGFQPNAHLYLDAGSVMTSEIGIRITPLALLTQEGRVEKAVTVPSLRKLLSLGDKGARLRLSGPV